MNTLSAPIPEVSISIVSHQQAGMIGALLKDMEHFCKSCPLEVILTINTPETLLFEEADFSFPLVVKVNPVQQGFSTNHNQAFALSRGSFFCVMNPDIRLMVDPFPELRACLADPLVGVVAPLVQGPDGCIEDSARRFPTPLRILRRVLGWRKDLDYPVRGRTIFPDWVGGMALLFPRAVFAKLGGFDSRYFLYYEDVDICARVRLLGHQVLQCPQVQVIHDAQRHSHRSFRYLRWHLRSMVRFFLSPVYWRVRWFKFSNSQAR
ncbi:glycosyltransferase family 2 protein [Rhodoferax sp. GW822-FHT02A01]|uniref:glycosyltransferase family 2 protein n=1 Tax=Rhodoferax sp. GW822-FHT02A01 TaxID=3141537 RepID=UPI00315D7370